MTSKAGTTDGEAGEEDREAPDDELLEGGTGALYPNGGFRPGQIALGATPLAPGLYIVATPIGHARDISLRALDVLAGADLIAAEDTRVTQKLLSIYRINARLVPYHDHNGEKMRPELIARLKEGARIALVSDAGTPLISDPGYKLVAAARDEGVAVFPIPGPSALLAGLAGAGLPTDRFLFLGFPPPKSAARRAAFDEIAQLRASLVLFEGPSRLAGCLADLAAVLGPRPAIVARELTKKFEEWRRGTLDELAEAYGKEEPPRGELVIIVGPPEGEGPPQADVEGLLKQALETMRVKQAVAAVAAQTGRPRKMVYALALSLTGGGDPPDEP